MIKKITLLLLVMLLISCSKEEDKENQSVEPFFNLKRGNVWVYKEYESNAEGALAFINKIDSVSVPGDTIIAGNTYSKILHEETGHHFSQFYWREDSNGHLVNEHGAVMHAGFDKTYYSSQLIGNGTINYYLLDPLNVTVEGNDYFVFPYHGEYVPLDPEARHEYLERSFQKDLGMITSHVSGSPSRELRLVSYTLN